MELTRLIYISDTHGESNNCLYFLKSPLLYYSMDTEIQLFPRKVYINTLSSTLVDHSPHILPQWITQSQINFVSAYQFASYNVEQQTTRIIPRDQGETEVMSVQFKAQMNEINCIMHYIFRQDCNFYLVHLPDQNTHPKILIYRNENEERQQIVQDFIDYLMNQGEKIESRASIISRTQKIIEEINSQENQGEENKNYEMSSVRQLIIVHQCNFAVLLVQMKTKSGLMLINMNKSQKLRSSQFYCPIQLVSERTTVPPLTPQENDSARIIYLFEDALHSIHRTRDITKFILHTNKHILLVKLNYQTMEMTILHKIQSTRKDKYLSVDIACSGEDEVVMALCQMSKVTAFHKLEITSKKEMRMFLIGQRKLTEIKMKKNQARSIKYQAEKSNYLESPDEQLEKQFGNVKFSTNVIQSRYEIDEPTQKDQADDLNRGILMKVFNEVLQSQQQIQKQNISEKQKSLKKIEQSMYRKSMTKSQSYENCFIKDIGGFTCNDDLVVIWQKKSAVLHVCKITSAKQQEDRYRSEKEEQKHKRSSQLQKQEQLKEVYIQLMGKTHPEKKQEKTDFQTIIEYQCKVQLGLTNPTIKNILLSPGNSNILIISGNDKRQSIYCDRQPVQFDIFQIDLFRQLGNQDPSIFFKPFKNIYKPKPIQTITTSIVKESTLFLTGNLVHSVENELLDGALSFDVHPYNIFLAVSFGFNVKVYALEGNEKLTTLYAMNGQGMKQVKYSPLGNHLCILFSKCIKIVDSYSFTTLFVFNQKNSNFLKCFYSSNGTQFFSLNQHHQIVAYNTFDYTKTDSIKPTNPVTEFKPISIKTFLKHSQYCFVLENGTLFAKYKANAVVVVTEQLYSYNDGQLINCIEIDQKNGILFTGCRSGIVRAHLWPDKDGSFDNYTEIRTSFSSITYLALSNTSPILYIGHHNGNISKAKYIIEREKRFELQNDRNAMMSDRNPRYMNLQNLNTIEKMYKFVLQNGAIVTEDLPEKLRLEYKLSEVIQKLNGQMRKLKCNIQQQLQQKAKMSVEKVDIGLLHHINQMITTKLYSQLRQETQANNKQLQQLKKAQAEEVKQILNTQNQLVKQKCFKISDFMTLRNQMKDKFDHEIKMEVAAHNTELNALQHQVTNAKKTMECQEEKVFFLPNDSIEQYKDHKIKLQRQLQEENKKHFELIKSCAYTETAIKDLYAKKIKEETHQIKVQLEKDEMQIKLDHNRQMIASLKTQIKEAELKVHKVQIESAVIKGNAQFKRVANIQEMNDACSYKLWMKKNIENEIAQLADSLAQIEELLNNKGNDVADQISIKNNANHIIKNKQEEIGEDKIKLKLTKLSLMQARNKLKKVNPVEQYKSLRNSFISKEKRSTVNSSERQQKSSDNDRRLKTSSSGRFISLNSKNIEAYNKVMDKQTKFMKSNIRAHHKKIKKFEKENGQLLFQYEKLKWEARDLQDRQIINQRALQNAKKESSFEQFEGLNSVQSSARMQLSKTPFQKYIQLKNAQNQKFKTATSTPCQLGTSTPSRLCTDRIN